MARKAMVPEPGPSARIGGPPVRPGDLHFVFGSSSRRLKGFDAEGRLRFESECRDDATGGSGFGHDGRCPRGTFRLGRPGRRNDPALGLWFTPVEDWEGGQALAEHGRAAIGIHGGGSGLALPFSGHQGWVETHGCLRLQNVDNSAFTTWVAQAMEAGGACWLTVEE